MSLITDERMIRNQAKLLIRDYEKYGSLSKKRNRKLYLLSRCNQYTSAHS